MTKFCFKCQGLDHTAKEHGDYWRTQAVINSNNSDYWFKAWQMADRTGVKNGLEAVELSRQLRKRPWWRWW